MCGCICLSYSSWIIPLLLWSSDALMRMGGRNPEQRTILGSSVAMGLPPVNAWDLHSSSSPYKLWQILLESTNFCHQASQLVVLSCKFLSPNMTHIITSPNWTQANPNKLWPTWKTQIIEEQLLVIIMITGWLSWQIIVFKPLPWWPGDSQNRLTFSLSIYLLE